MRWIFLLLLALNLAYVTWELNRPAELAGVSAGKHKIDAPPIVLLSESRSVQANSIQTIPSVPEDVAVTEPAIEKPVAERVAASQTAEVEKPSVQSPAIPPASAAEPDSAPEPDRVMTAHVADACYTLGPFREVDKLRKVTRDIREYVVDASFRSYEESEQSMYWVYLPSQPNRAAATALGKQLESKKIRDYYVINSGNQKNGISLGHFKEQARAQGLMKRVQKAGFEPVLEPVFKTYTIYWLDYRVQADKNIPQNALDLRSMPNVSRINRECG